MAARIQQERAAAAEARGATRSKSKPVYVNIFAVAAALSESAQQHTAAAARARTGFHKHARRGRYGPGGRGGHWPEWMKATALHHLGKSGSVQTTRKFLKSNYVASFDNLSWQTLDNWRRKRALEQVGAPVGLGAAVAAQQQQRRRGMRAAAVAAAAMRAVLARVQARWMSASRPGISIGAWRVRCALRNCCKVLGQVP